MIVGWMAYLLVVGALVAVAALAAEGACRRAGVPTRWAWTGALALVTLFGALAPLRPPVRSVSVIAVKAPAGTLPSRDVVAAHPLDRLRAVVADVRRAVATGVDTVLAVARGVVPATLDRALAGAWLLASLATLLLFGAVYGRVHRVRASWPTAEVQGVPVRVAPAAGPAVVGLLRAQIVVPLWLLGRPADEQRMVLAHEREHVRAGDALLLAFGCLVAALLAWHPAVWWMLSRLRLAVEVDCDARVLRQGVAPRPYGSTLLALAGRPPGLPVGTLALATRTTHLERRLKAMIPTHVRFARARGVALAGVTLVAILAACEASVPTDAEVQEMDVVAAERQASKVALVNDSTTRYIIDDMVATATEARALDAKRIASIQVSKSKVPGDPSEVRIFTLSPTLKAKMENVRIDSMKVEGLQFEARRTRYDVSVGKAEVEGPTAMKGRFNGLLFIDGVQVERTALDRLAPAAIASVEVIKGDRAKSLYGDPAAANGVIKVTTKAALTTK